MTEFVTIPERKTPPGTVAIYGIGKALTGRYRISSASMVTDSFPVKPLPENPSAKRIVGENPSRGHKSALNNPHLADSRESRYPEKQRGCWKGLTHSGENQPVQGLNTAPGSRRLGFNRPEIYHQTECKLLIFVN